MLKLRPREGWRVFAGEVGVIVLGVLIALGAQQLADEWQWRQTVNRTKADLDNQIRSNIVNIAERAAVDRCLSARLADLAARVAANDGDWKGDPYRMPGEGMARTLAYAVPAAYRMPARNFPRDVWDQAKAGGVLSHMRPQEISRYAIMFDDISDVKRINESERSLAATLSFLSFDGPLSAQDRSRALSTIAQLDHLNKDILSNLGRLVEAATALGGKFSADDEKTLIDYLDTQVRFRGPCVDRAATLKLVAPLRGR